MLASGRYEGRPLAAHLRLKGVGPEHFEIWLRLFRQTAGEVCPGDVAVIFIDRAERIAESFQLGMFFRPASPQSFPPRSVPLPSSPPTQRRHPLSPTSSPKPRSSAIAWYAWCSAIGRASVGERGCKNR